MELICSTSGEDSNVYPTTRPLHFIYIFRFSCADRILVEIILRRYPLQDNDIMFVYMWKVFALGLLISYAISYLVRVYIEDPVRTILTGAVSTENRKLKSF